MRKFLAVLPMLLCGCVEHFDPVPIEITDPVQYAVDVKVCQAAAAAYKPKPDLASIAAGTVNGAADNASGAAVNPAVPLLGAAGGATHALVTNLNILGHASANVARHCLEEKAHRDRSAIIANPND